MSDCDITSLLLQPVEWQKRALCGEPDVDTEIFYMERGQSSNAACAWWGQCTVRDVCLDFALNDPDARSWDV